MLCILKTLETVKLILISFKNLILICLLDQQEGDSIVL
jgi:hypothetical protein